MSTKTSHMAASIILASLFVIKTLTGKQTAKNLSKLIGRNVKSETVVPVPIKHGIILHVRSPTVLYKSHS